MPPFPTLVGPSATGASRLANSERTAGFYLEKNDGPGAVFPWTMLPLPGLTLISTVPEGPGRGNWAQDGRFLRCAGYKVYEMDSTLTETYRGSVARDMNPAQFACSGDSGRQVAIASGGKVYVFDLDALTFSAALQFSSGPATDVPANFIAYLSGRFLALDVATSTMYASDLIAGLLWAPSMFTQRDGAGDRWTSMLVCGSYIHLFGSETTDFYYDGAAGGAFPFPFVQVPGATIPVGIAAGYSAAVLAGTPIWLARSANGGQFLAKGNGTGMPSRISSHAFDTAIRGYSTITDAEAWVTEIDGHGFYVISFPTVGRTWVYDASSGQLTEWPYWNSVTGREEAHRALHHAYAFGRRLVDDRATGDLYTLDPDVYTDNGATIRRVRRVPIPKLTAENYWIFLQELELFMDTGIGLQNGPDADPPVQGSDPTVTLRISRDSGHTWGHEITCSAGAVGDYFERVIFQQLGRYRDGTGVVELVFTDPVPWRLSGGAFQARVGIR